LRARFPVDARLDGRTFVTFHVDLGVGDEILEPLESVEGEDWLGFAGLIRLLAVAEWCRASVFLRVRVLVGVQPSGSVESMDQDWGDGQKSHSGCSVKYGAMSQPASKASSAVSNVSV
jgi:hypothetical protein